MTFVFVAFLAVAPCTPTLGADLTDISHAARRTRGIPDFVAGALVRVVWAGGPAGRAGVEAGDVIQGVGDDLVQNACDVRLAVAKHGCGEVRLAIRRGRDTLALDATLVDGARFRRKATSCENGDGAACTALAKAHDDDIVLLRQACDLGDAEGCFMLGLKLGNGKEGAAAYEQACDSGNPLACTNLGFIRQNAGDLDAALRLYKQGCDGSRCSGRNNLGCVNLGRLYRDGIGVKADPERAIAIFREVCDRGDSRACSAAGTTWLYGEGVAHDVPRSLELLEKGCRAGDTLGCFNLGAFYEPQDRARAAGYYKRACDRGDTEACDRVRVLHQRQQ